MRAAATTRTFLALLDTVRPRDRWALREASKLSEQQLPVTAHDRNEASRKP